MDNAAAGKKLRTQLLKVWYTIDQYVRKWLQSSTERKKVVHHPYHSLSPKEDADPDGNYSSALLWALQCDSEQDIKNIALTGPYGSGKSSILRTFEKKHGGKDFKFLRISLATFRDPKHEPAGDNLSIEETDNDHSESNTDENINKGESESDILRLIEYSILQQIFYHEDVRNLPDSRIKRTKSYRKIWMWVFSFSLFFYFMSIIYLWKPYWILDKFFLPKESDYKIYYQAIALIIMALGTIYIIYSAIRPFRSIRVNKFSIQDVEFSLSSKIDRSILNKHLDEILYFFEVSKYNVVIIEDLDRFEKTEIFTKLRELNHLINYSKAIKKKKKKVVFIYAVREDMFHNKDRIKFFDFIIPVIPIVDSSNSDEMLEKIVVKDHPELDKNFLSDISMFIDDMRLLYNILNEYKLYTKNLKEKLNLEPNKLLAMALYKNLYPKDFLDLCNSEGELYQVFAKKEDNVESYNTILKKEIEKLRVRVKDLQKLPIKDVKELRKLYLLQYLIAYPTAKKFINDEKEYDFEEVLEGNIFENFIKNNFRYIESEFDTEKDISISFKEIEDKVDPSTGYHQRLATIRDTFAPNIEHLRDQIRKKEEQSATLRYSQIKEQMEAQDDLIIVNFKDDRQSQLVRILLRKGYIDENYSYYVSLFHEGALTRSDKEFVLNVQGHLRMDPDYQLEHVEKIVSKLDVSEFEKDYLLNFNILDYLMSSEKDEPKLNRIMQVLSNGKDISILFLNYYISHCTSIQKFIHRLAKQWPNMWKAIERNDNKLFTEELKDTYFKLILSYADINDIKIIAGRSSFVNVCAGKINFLTLLDDHNRIKEIIAALRIKFTDVDIKGSLPALVEYVYENNYYDINVKTLSKWYKYKDVYNENEFYTRNYSFLITNKDRLANLYEYIHNHMEKYIRQVWLELDNSTNERASILPNILNVKNFTSTGKKLFLERNQTVVSSLSEIKELEDMQLILKSKKLEITWGNLLHYFGKNGYKFDEHLVELLNNESISASLGQIISLNSKELLVVYQWESFIHRLIREEKLSTANYRNLLNVIANENVPDVNFDGLSEEKVFILVDLGVIKMNPGNFKSLYKKYPGLQVKLLGMHQDEYLKEPGAYPFHFNEVPGVLLTQQLSVEVKNKVISQLEENIILYHSEIQNYLIEYLKREKRLIQEKFPIKKEILMQLLKVQNIELPRRIDIMTIFLDMFNKEDFVEIMRSWGDPFSYIAPGSGRIGFDKSSVIADFAQKLKQLDFIDSVEISNDKIYMHNF